MRRLLALILFLLLIAACGGGDDNNNVVSQQTTPTVRNFPTTAPTVFAPTLSPSPTNSFGSVNPVSGCPIPAGWQAYVVAFGDTLGTIADNIGSTVETIQAGNCISNELIYSGQLIFLPSLPLGIPTVDPRLWVDTGGVFVPTATTGVITAPISCSTPPGWVAYGVQAGDTLGDLATRTNTTVGNLQNGNCLGSSELIFVGQILYLPRTPDAVVTATFDPAQPTPTPNSSCAIPAGWIAYRVVAGDTLGVIADTYGTTAAILQNGNCLPSAEIIYVGQIIYVPSGIIATAAPTLTPIISTQTAATATATAATNNGQGPGVLTTLTVRPTLARDDGALVTLQTEVALDVGVVSNADLVRYYAGTSATDPAPVQVGQDTDPFDGTQITYTFATFDVELYFFAVAQNEFGSSRSPTVHVVYDPTYATGSGAPDILQFLGFDGSIYTLQAGATVTINWASYPEAATRVDFLLVEGSQTSIIASDSNPSDGARVTWGVPSRLVAGQLYALATLAGGQTIESDRVSVFVQGTD